MLLWMLGTCVLEEKTMISSRAITGERLVNVLQSIALKQQTGRLSIEHGNEREREKGEIFFACGNTVFARTSHESGETALFTMLHWQEIHYTFLEGEQAPENTIHQQRAAVALRPSRGRAMLPIELEETRQTPAIGMPAIPKTVRNVSGTFPRVQGYNSSRQFPASVTHSLQPQPAVAFPPSQRDERPSIHAIFRALPSASTPIIMNQMARKDRIVFLLLDGKRTLGTITQLVHRDEMDVMHTIVHLFKQGYIEYIKR